MRDQTNKVYQWEAQWLQWGVKAFNNLNGPRSWMRWAAKKYDVPYTRVRETHRSYSFYRPHDNTIYLVKQHWNIATVMHEMAHAIADFYYGESQGHNSRWLGVFLWLLEHAMVAPREALRASARASGLQFSYHVTPKRLKRNVLNKKKKKGKAR